MCLINSIANVRGKGRDDLGIEILEKARLLLLNEKKMSKSIVKLVQLVIDSFQRYLDLLLKYSKNIELVDP